MGQAHTYFIYIQSLLYGKHCIGLIFTYIVSFNFYYNLYKLVSFLFEDRNEEDKAQGGCR